MQHNRHSYLWITVSFVSQSHSGCLVIYLYEAMKSQFICESCWLFSLLNTCTCIWLLSHSFSFHCEQWVIQIFLSFCDIILFYRSVCFPLINSTDIQLLQRYCFLLCTTQCLCCYWYFSYKYYNFHYYQGGPKVICCDENWFWKLKPYHNSITLHYSYNCIMCSLKIGKFPQLL